VISPLFYYKDRNFIRRIVPAPEKSDVCRTSGCAEGPALTEAPAGEGTAGISAAAAGLAVTLDTMGSVRTNRNPDVLPDPDLLKEDKEDTEKPDKPEVQEEDESEEEDDYLHNILMLAQIREEEREENDHDRGIAL
jgi:hypothetical protein